MSHRTVLPTPFLLVNIKNVSAAFSFNERQTISGKERRREGEGKESKGRREKGS
jgi:hypothetical protein